MPSREQFATNEEYNKYYRDYRKKNREKMRAYYRKYNSDYRIKYGYYNEIKWKKENPEKRRVEELARYAIKIGVLKRLPCENCGAKRSQAHHDDYSKPLEVRFLCAACHKAFHIKLNNKNAKRGISGNFKAKK